MAISLKHTFKWSRICWACVGNTNISLGLMQGNEVIGSFRLTTKTPRTSDEFGLCQQKYTKFYKTSQSKFVEYINFFVNVWVDNVWIL